MPGPASTRSPLLIVFFVVFLDLLGFGIVIPILPYYAKAYGADALTLGWLLAAYSAISSSSRPCGVACRTGMAGGRSSWPPSWARRLNIYRFSSS